MFDNSEEYDFTPSDSSKLSSLFGTTMMSSDDISSDLKYTAPKQPKKPTQIQEESKDRPQSIALTAKIISLWKLDNKNYSSLGRHGLAIIGSVELNMYELIAYKEKNNVIIRLKVNSNLKFYIQKDNFATFYDTNFQNWLVKFDNSVQQNEFSDSVSSCGGIVIPSIEEKEHSANETTIIKPEPLPKPILSSDTLDENQLDGSESQKKANILNRMARMGQQILPKQFIKSTSSDISDSDQDHDRKTLPRRMKKNLHAEKVSSPKNDDIVHNHPLALPSYNYPSQFSQSVPFPNYYEGFNHYIMNQNSDIKMNLVQISSKLESVLSMNPYKQNDSILESKIKALELQCENLQTNLDRANKKYDKLFYQYKELQNNNQATMIVEKDNIIESLKVERSKLEIALKEIEDKMNKHFDLQSMLTESRRMVEEYETTIHGYSKKEIENEKQVRILEGTIENLSLQLNDLKVYLKKTGADRKGQLNNHNETLDMMINMVKIEMDAMYQQLMAEFVENCQYTSKDIQVKIVKELKKTSFKIIKNCQDICSQNADVLHS